MSKRNSGRHGARKPMFKRADLAALGLAATALAPQLALAQNPVPPVEPKDRLNQQEPKRPDYVKPAPDASFELPPVAPTTTSPAPTGQAIQVDRVAFRGNTVIATGELERVAAPYTGRKVDLAEIEELRQKISHYYIDRGYINSGALIGKNALDGTTLTFDIVEGRLNAINLQGMQRLNESYVRDRLVKDMSAPLNIDDLRERFQLLLGDPLIERLNARLIPDTKLGEAILDVDVTRARPYQLRAVVNNYRPPSIGSNGAALSGWVRNLTGYGDFLEATAQDSIDNFGDGRRGSLGWVMPLNNRGTQFSINLDHGRSSVVEEPMRSLDIKSTLDSKDIGLAQNLIENLTHKFTIGVNRVRRENRTTLLGEPFSFVPGEPNGVTRIYAWRTWQEYSYRTETQVLAMRSTFSFTRNNLQTIEGLPVTGEQAPNRYNLWLGQAQYARQMMDNGAQLVVRGTLQQARHHMLALDQIAIGGAGTVRGYRENQLIRDKGAIVNVELEYPVIRNSGSGLNMLVIPFYDYGRGKNVGESSSMLSSAGLATRVQWNGFNLDLALAKKLGHSGVNTSGNTLQDKGVHFQLSYKFFGN